MTENFCSNCGKPLLRDDNFCSGCGKSTVRAEISAPTASTPQYIQQVHPEYKDPFTAAFGSIIIVGVGHFYIGKWWRGLGFLALAISLGWATIGVASIGAIAIWILAAMDAYSQANKHNIKYGYSKEEPFEALPYLRDKAGIFGGIFLFIGLIGLLGVIVEMAFVWILIPMIFVALGIGFLYLKLTQFG